MRFVKKAAMLPIVAVAAILAGGVYAVWRFTPKCHHGEEKFSFPRHATKEGIAVRTCNECGQEKAYDMVTMQFVDNKEADRLTAERKRQEGPRASLDPCCATGI